MKKGFTLVELLAVIIILSVIMIIAVPNVLNKLEEAKRSGFISEVQSMYKAAEQQYTINKLLNKEKNCFNSSQVDNIIDSTSNGLIYKIHMDDEGSITSVYVYNTVTLYEYYNSNVEKIEDISQTKGTLNSNVKSYNEEIFTNCP